MIAHAQQARDQIDALLLEEDVEGAIAVAQTLWFLCETPGEFNSCLDHMLEFALGKTGPLGEGTDRGRVPERTVFADLEKSDRWAVRDAVVKLRADSFHNFAMMAAPKEHLLAS